MTRCRVLFSSRSQGTISGHIASVINWEGRLEQPLIDVGWRFRHARFRDGHAACSNPCARSAAAFVGPPSAGFVLTVARHGGSPVRATVGHSRGCSPPAMTADSPTPVESSLRKPRSFSCDSLSCSTCFNTRCQPCRKFRSRRIRAPQSNIRQANSPIITVICVPFVRVSRTESYHFPHVYMTHLRDKFSKRPDGTAGGGISCAQPKWRGSRWSRMMNSLRSGLDARSFPVAR